MVQRSPAPTPAAHRRTGRRGPGHHDRNRLAPGLVERSSVVVGHPERANLRCRAHRPGAGKIAAQSYDHTGTNRLGRGSRSSVRAPCFHRRAKIEFDAFGDTDSGPLVIDADRVPPRNLPNANT